MRLAPLVRLTALVASLGLIACDSGSTGSASGKGQLKLALPFSFAGAPIAAQQRVESDAAEVDRLEVKIVVKRTGESVLSRSIREGDGDITGGDDSDPVVTLSFRVPEDAEGETFTVTIDVFDDAGTKIFTIGPADFQLGEDGRSATVTADAIYVGPGRDLTGVVLAPRSISVTVGQTAPFTCRGTPGDVTNFLYQVSSGNPGVMSVENTATIRGLSVGSTELICELAFGSRAEDRIPVTVTSGGTSSLTLTSGGGQSAAAGAQLANPIVVTARNADGSFAPGVTVQFNPGNGGSVQPTTAVTNSQGQAQTLWTLGTGAGTQTLAVIALVQGSPHTVNVSATATAPQPTGTVNGVVRNVTNDALLANATVVIRSGANNTSGTILESRTTGANGAFSFAMAPGQYTLQASASGFSNASANVSLVAGQTVVAPALALAPPLAGGQVRIVLTWIDTELDLDSHTLVPTSPSPTIVFWNSPFVVDQGCVVTSNPFACLQTDNSPPDEPATESTLIGTVLAGTYQFMVHNYTADFANQINSTSLGGSGAKVEVFVGTSVTPAQTFNVPTAGVGNRWVVFSMQSVGGNLQFTPLNHVDEVNLVQPPPAGTGAGASAHRKSPPVDRNNRRR